MRGALAPPPDGFADPALGALVPALGRVTLGLDTLLPRGAPVRLPPVGLLTLDRPAGKEDLPPLGRGAERNVLPERGRATEGEALPVLGRAGEERTVEDPRGAVGRFRTLGGRDPGMVCARGGLARRTLDWLDRTVELGRLVLARGAAMRVLARALDDRAPACPVGRLEADEARGKARVADELCLEAELPRAIGDAGRCPPLPLGEALDPADRAATLELAAPSAPRDVVRLDTTPGDDEYPRRGTDCVRAPAAPALSPAVDRATALRALAEPGATLLGVRARSGPAISAREPSCDLATAAAAVRSRATLPASLAPSCPASTNVHARSLPAV